MVSDKILINNYKGITADSRQVKPGFIYVSIQGEKFNGDNFVFEAVSKGATLIIISDESSLKVQATTQVIKTRNTRSLLANLANQFYQPQPKNIVAITGTSGKTSVAYYYQQIAELLGNKSASIGSLGIISNSLTIPLEDPFATPDPVTLNQILQQLATSQVTHVAMEASSHGIEQKRIESIKFSAAAFTNFSQDHLDYHLTMDEYFKSKMKLFTSILDSGYAIINSDITEYQNIINIISTNKNLKILTYGKYSHDIKFSNKRGKSIELEILGKKFNTIFNPDGHFQIYNLMAAIGLALSTNLELEQIMEVVPQLKAAAGRLQKVAQINGARIFVDYSHKPGALDNVLQTLKQECNGQLYVIFGCGGDRDKLKRPIMGRIASQIAHHVIVTDDNPRTENAATIRKEILVECPNALEYDNRAKAISETIQKLKSNDILLIAGKGNETYQIIGSKKFNFSDSEEVLKAVKKH